MYNQILGGKPWWGLEGVFAYGSGLYSINGPSEESRSFLNPLLLIGIKEASAYAARPPKVPASRNYFPHATRLVFGPKERRLWIEYQLDGAVRHLSRLFPRDPRKEWRWALTAINARDLGFRYLSFLSHRGVKRLMTQKVVQLSEFVHLGGSCGYPGGCNNTSPRVPAFEFKVVSFPAYFSLGLWYERPRDSEKPDLSAQVSLKCFGFGCS